MGPIEYIPLTALSGDPTSVQGRPVPLYHDDVQTVSWIFQVSSGASTPAGTFVIEATNSPEIRRDIAFGESNSVWHDVSDLFTVPAHTADGTYRINGSFAGFAALRVRATRTTGSFSIQGWLSTNDRA